MQRVTGEEGLGEDMMRAVVMSWKGGEGVWERDIVGVEVEMVIPMWTLCGAVMLIFFLIFLKRNLSVRNVFIHEV